MTGSFWAPSVLAVVAGLALLLAGAGGWVSAMDERTVGGVLVTESASISGTQFAPLVVVFGLLGLVGGVALGVLRGSSRKVIAGLLVAAGAAAVVVVTLGISRAGGQAGELTPAPFFALFAAAALAVAGAVGVRAPARPPAASPYRVEQERAGDDEWALAASDPDESPDPRHHSGQG